MKSSVEIFREMLCEQPPREIVETLYRAAVAENEHPEDCAALALAIMALKKQEATRR